MTIIPRGTPLSTREFVRRTKNEQCHIKGERKDAHLGHRSFDSPALYPAERSRPAGSAVWLRTRPVRGVHSNHQWRSDAVLRHAGVQSKEGDHDAGRTSQERQAAPDTASLDRGAGPAMRFLPERADDD